MVCYPVPMLTRLSLLSLIPLAACAGKPVPTAPTAAPEPAEVTREGAERVTITLDPSEMSVDEAAGIATFSPGSRMMSAEYTHYLLDLASLKAALGGLPEAPVELIIAVDARTESSFRPEDPNLPSPMGGFLIKEVRAHVISKAK